MYTCNGLFFLVRVCCTHTFRGGVRNIGRSCVKLQDVSVPEVEAKSGRRMALIEVVSFFCLNNSPLLVVA